MDTISAQEALHQLFQIIQVATQDKRQFRITSEAGNVIVLPEETYDNILVTLELLSTPGLMDNLNFSSEIDIDEEVEAIAHASSRLMIES